MLQFTRPATRYYYVIFIILLLITNYELQIMYKTLLCTYVFRGTIILRNVL